MKGEHRLPFFVPDCFLFPTFIFYIELWGMVPDNSLHSDHELFLRLQAGDEAAFSKLYEVYAPGLVDFAAARLHSLEEARDIIHDLFVHLWQERMHITIQVSFRAFIYAAVRYRIIDHIRRDTTRQKYAVQIERLPQTATAMEDEVDARDLQKSLFEAIEQLSPRMREVFKLSRFEHKSVSEIAKQMAISEQTVKNQLSTALSLLRARLSKIAFVLWWL